MLTKKHFKAVAEIINKTTNESVSTGVTYPKIDKRKFVFELADYFATQNPRFDCGRFMAACELGG